MPTISQLIFRRRVIRSPGRSWFTCFNNSGSDNSHFDNPFDVAVDRNGYIYVADEGNDRIQVFNSNRQYVRTIGGGGTGSDFGHWLMSVLR
jgi:DNA-binding beta-propeller fold protein YncE